MFNPTCFNSNFFRQTVLTLVAELGLLVKPTDTELQVEFVLAIRLIPLTVVVQYVCRVRTSLKRLTTGGVVKAVV